MVGGRQIISLNANGCMYTGTAIHEIMHALGFYHEQTRTDRDYYIKIHWDNIDPSKNTFNDSDSSFIIIV